MVRKLFSGRMGLAVAAALSLAGFASSSNAATITFDLRAIGGTGTINNPKDVNVTLGQTVTLGLYAQVANADGDRTNDGYILSNFNINSSEAIAGSVLGNLSVATLNTDVVNSTLSQTGTVQDLNDVTPDSDLDQEVGGTNPSALGGYIIPSNGTTKFATGSGAGPTEFFLGTVTWTSTVAAPGLTPTSLNYFLRIRTDGNAAGKLLVKYVTDGVTKNLPGDNSNSPTGDIAITGPVVISTVPEPTALGLLGVGALAALRRRRSI